MFNGDTLVLLKMNACLLTSPMARLRSCTNMRTTPCLIVIPVCYDVPYATILNKEQTRFKMQKQESRVAIWSKQESKNKG